MCVVWSGVGDVCLRTGGVPVLAPSWPPATRSGKVTDAEDEAFRAPREAENPWPLLERLSVWLPLLTASMKLRFGDKPGESRRMVRLRYACRRLPITRMERRRGSGARMV